MQRRSATILQTAVAGVFLTCVAVAQKPADAKTRGSGKPRPPEDPALAEFGIFAKSAPNPAKVAAAETRLPLTLGKGARVALVGNTLLDRAQWFGNLEAMMQLAHPRQEVVVRHFAWSADEPDLQPRPDNFATVPQHLTREKMDVVVAAFGFNESFGGEDKIPEFKARLSKWVAETKTSAFNGVSAPRVVLLSPIANENVPGVAAADLNNQRLAAYTSAMKEVAESEKVGFVDLFHATLPVFAEADSTFTINGVHLSAKGDEMTAGWMFRGIFGSTPPTVNEEIRAAVVDKNRQYFRRYRPLNTF